MLFLRERQRHANAKRQQKMKKKSFAPMRACHEIVEKGQEIRGKNAAARVEQFIIFFGTHASGLCPSSGQNILSTFVKSMLLQDKTVESPLSIFRPRGPFFFASLSSNVSLSSISLFLFLPLLIRQERAGKKQKKW